MTTSFTIEVNSQAQANVCFEEKSGQPMLRISLSLEILLSSMLTALTHLQASSTPPAAEEAKTPASHGSWTHLPPGFFDASLEKDEILVAAESKGSNSVQSHQALGFTHMGATGRPKLLNKRLRRASSVKELCLHGSSTKSMPSGHSGSVVSLASRGFTPLASVTNFKLLDFSSCTVKQDPPSVRELVLKNPERSNTRAPWIALERFDAEQFALEHLAPLTQHDLMELRHASVKDDDLVIHVRKDVHEQTSRLHASRILKDLDSCWSRDPSIFIKWQSHIVKSVDPEKETRRILFLAKRLCEMGYCNSEVADAPAHTCHSFADEVTGYESATGFDVLAGNSYMKENTDVDSVTLHSRRHKNTKKRKARLQKKIFGSHSIDSKPGMMSCPAFERQHKFKGNMAQAAVAQLQSETMSADFRNSLDITETDNEDFQIALSRSVLEWNDQWPSCFVCRERFHPDKLTCAENRLCPSVDPQGVCKERVCGELFCRQALKHFFSDRYFLRQAPERGRDRSSPAQRLFNRHSAATHILSQMRNK